VLPQQRDDFAQLLDRFPGPENYLWKAAAALAIEVDVGGVRLHALSLPGSKRGKQPPDASNSQAPGSRTVAETATAALSRDAPTFARYDF
jgi:hypothetical protein